MYLMSIALLYCISFTTKGCNVAKPVLNLFVVNQILKNENLFCYAIRCRRADRNKDEPNQEQLKYFSLSLSFLCSPLPVNFLSFSQLCHKVSTLLTSFLGT